MARRKASGRRPKDDEFSKEDLELARWALAMYDFKISATKEDRALLEAWIKTGDLRTAVRKVAPHTRSGLVWFKRRLTKMRERLVRIITLLPPGRKRDVLLRHFRVDKRGPRASTPRRLARVSKLRRPK